MSAGPSLTTPFDRSLGAALPSITLAELDSVAALQQRVDRKYVVTGVQLGDAMQQLSHRLAVLDIEGRRTFSYESTYFDTADLESFHGAAYRRRRRFKVRSRSYLDSGITMLEVKTRGRRSQTIKERQPHSFEQRALLDEGSHAFIDAVLSRPGLGRSLVPTLTTTYRRTTLVDLDDVARVTVDADLMSRDCLDRRAFLCDRFVLETKSTTAPSATDRYLWSVGIRPATISKYATSLAALDPSLSSNKWHQVLQRHMVTAG